MGKCTGLIVTLVAGLLAAVTVIGCQEEAATGPEVADVNLARLETTGTVPEVTGADPASAPQDTTLDVKVSGSAFDRGSAVVLTLGGVATEKVRTNTTRYRNSKTLIANITIAADAEVDLYDVEVMTARGKKGIGTEMFEVREKIPANLTVVTVELVGPAEGEVDEGDPYNVRSAGQHQVWRNYEGDWMNLELRDFPITLAFSEADSIAMTDPNSPVQGECPVVHDWIFGNDTLVGLQERAEPLHGLFSFGFNGGAAIFWFDIADPFGDGYTYHLSLYAKLGRSLEVTTAPDGTTTYRATGTFVSIGQWRHVKRDPYKTTRPAETPWCKVPLADYTLVVTE